MLLEQEILRDHRSHATGATQLRGHDGQVQQGEQEVLHARVSVGQTSGATQRCRNPGIGARIGNSRRTGAARQRQPAFARRHRHVHGGARAAGSARFQQSQDTYFALAKDTGGKALVDYNDLSLGIRQAAEAQSELLHPRLLQHACGERRKVPSHTRSPQGQHAAGGVDASPGYFADKEWKQQNGVERERQLEDALMLENPITDITIALELNYFQVTRRSISSRCAVKIPGSELELARRRGAKRLTLDVLVEVKDSYGATQRNMRDQIEVSLTAANAERLATQPVQYDTGFTVLPGKYVLKFLVRDAEVGRIGTYQTSFTIPNLNREPTRLPISSVVLGSQRLTVNEALYNVKTTDKQSIGHPLIDERPEATAERDARIQRVTRHVRLPGGLRAVRRDAAAADCVRHLLPGRREGARKPAGYRDRRRGSYVEGHSGASEHSAISARATYLRSDPADRVQGAAPSKSHRRGRAWPAERPPKAPSAETGDQARAC